MNDQELLSHCNEYLNYDPETGIFTHKKRFGASHARIGAEAGTLNNGKYMMIHAGKVKIGAHRVAFLMTHHYLPEFIDHINQVKNDNRIQNLRGCTKSQNNINVGPRKNNTSGYKGVSWHNSSNKWITKIRYNTKDIHIGVFSCKIEAAKAYDKKAKELQGSFAYLNFPVPNVAPTSDRFGS